MLSVVQWLKNPGHMNGNSPSIILCDMKQLKMWCTMKHSPAIVYKDVENVSIFQNSCSARTDLPQKAAIHAYEECCFHVRFRTAAHCCLLSLVFCPDCVS